MSDKELIVKNKFARPKSMVWLTSVCLSDYDILTK